MGILYFNEGKLANASGLDSGALALGNVLQQMSMTTYHHIEEAYAQQLQDPLGKRIGERLVLMQVITEQQLHEALRMKTIWTVANSRSGAMAITNLLPAQISRSYSPMGKPHWISRSYVQPWE